jgi:hypothetical protein
VGHASRSSGLLHVEGSRVRVSYSGLKTGVGATAGGDVASLWSLHRDQAKDGWVDVMGHIGPCYHYFAVFSVLGPRGILVFCLSL